MSKATERDNKLIVITGHTLPYIKPTNKYKVIDKPETGLHPKAQREMARLIVKILNKSRKSVVLLTHSDYIIKELNIMIRLFHFKDGDQWNINQDKCYDYDHLIAVTKKNGYDSQPLLNYKKVFSFHHRKVNENNLNTLELNTDNIKTETPAELEKLLVNKYGLEIPSIDSEIDEMNDLDLFIPTLHKNHQ